MTRAALRLRDLPGPPGLPLIGNLHRIRLDRLHATLEGWAGRYGPLYRIRIGPRRVAVLSDRASIERILVERPHGFRRARSLEAAAEGMGLKGVFAAEGEDWRRQRRIVAAALRRARIEDFFPRLAETVDRLRRRWERAADAGEPVDLCRDLMRFTVDATVRFRLRVRSQHAGDRGSGDPAPSRDGVSGAAPAGERAVALLAPGPPPVGPRARPRARRAEDGSRRDGGRGAGAARRGARAAGCAGGLPGGDRGGGGGRRLLRRGHLRQRGDPAARRRGHHGEHDRLDGSPARRPPGMAGTMPAGGGRSHRAVRRDRDAGTGRPAPGTRRGVQRGDAAQARRAAPCRRAAGRQRDHGAA